MSSSTNYVPPCLNHSNHCTKINTSSRCLASSIQNLGIYFKSRQRHCMFLSAWICQIFVSKWCLHRSMSGAVSSFCSKVGNILRKERSYTTCFSLPASANSSIKNNMLLCRVWCSLSHLKKRSKSITKDFMFCSKARSKYERHHQLPKYTFKSQTVSTMFLSGCVCQHQRQKPSSLIPCSASSLLSAQNLERPLKTTKTHLMCFSFCIRLSQQQKLIAQQSMSGVVSSL